MGRILAAFFIFFTCASASARVFNFSAENVAPYVNAIGGWGQLGQDPYFWQTPASFTGSQADYLYGGDIGVLFRSNAGFGFFAGVRVMTMASVEGVQAFNGSSAQIYSVDSSAVTYAPMGGFLIQFGQSKMSLWNFSIGAGYQYAKVENAYTMTAQGTTDTGLSDFSESLKQQSLFMLATIGYEVHLSGASTLVLDLGYQYTFPAKWKYGAGGANLTGGITQGGDVRLEDGSEKSIDFSYPYVQIGFRFYIETI